MQLYSAEVLEYMNQLSASLKETYANTVHEEDYIPVKGEVCVAKYTVDQVTSLEMNYLIRCFNLLSLYQLDTRAFNDAFGGLKARLVQLLFFFLRQFSRLCSVACSLRKASPALFMGSSVLLPGSLLALQLVFICVAEAPGCHRVDWAKIA